MGVIRQDSEDWHDWVGGDEAFASLQAPRAANTTQTHWSRQRRTASVACLAVDWRAMALVPPPALPQREVRPFRLLVDHGGEMGHVKALTVRNHAYHALSSHPGFSAESPGDATRGEAQRSSSLQRFVAISAPLDQMTTHSPSVVPAPAEGISGREPSSHNTTDRAWFVWYSNVSPSAVIKINQPGVMT